VESPFNEKVNNLVTTESSAPLHIARCLKVGDQETLQKHNTHDDDNRREIYPPDTYGRRRLIRLNTGSVAS